jgi:hypothetical protein
MWKAGSLLNQPKLDINPLAYQFIFEDVIVHDTDQNITIRGSHWYQEFLASYNLKSTWSQIGCFPALRTLVVVRICLSN